VSVYDCKFGTVLSYVVQMQAEKEEVVKQIENSAWLKSAPGQNQDQAVTQVLVFLCLLAL
jgi:hypothetical protein